MSEEIEATVNDLQNQLTAVHAALEGKGQAGLCKADMKNQILTIPYESPHSIRSEYARKFKVLLWGGMLHHKKATHQHCLHCLVFTCLSHQIITQ